MAGQTGKYKDTKLRGMRKTIAERMAYSARENAAITQSRAVDVTELLKSREAKKAEYAQQGISVPTVNDIMLKATALALRKHPNLNSTFEENIIRTYEDININMAVALPNGLITPVIRNVDQLSVWEISMLSKEAAEKAKNGMLTVDDMIGGTFTVTNVGALKIEVATPIINPPQVGILGVGTVVPGLERINGEIVDRFKMYLSLTVDHRIIDGYPAAMFLMTLSEILEKPELIWG